MEIRYNVTGQDRKALVSAVCETLGSPQKYLGAPTFSYEIGGYTIDKNGALTGNGSISSENNSRLIQALSGMGFIGEVADRGDAEEAAEAESRIYRAELSDPDCPERMEVFHADDDEDALRQAFDYAVDGVVLLELHELDSNYDTVRPVEIPPSPDRLAIEVPKDGFTDTAIENLEKLVASKAALIQRALDTDALPIEITDDTIRFPWFTPQGDAALIRAYTQFITALCNTAKEQKRVTAKEKPVDNEKYAFRCFLLRLGFIGEEYKAARKALLSRLEGNGSWKHGKKPEVATNEEVYPHG